MNGRAESVMPWQLLERLRCARLPARTDDDDEIDKLAVLRSAGLIDADLPLMRRGRGHHSYAGNAIVMRVTPQGQVAAEEPIDPTRMPATDT